ncbi:hypothetical protein ANAEL_03699 [Anaerolineales bacterium]|nr:hypothetical protein ANAEL_03699 [Anaerolineales bacterium]
MTTSNLFPAIIEASAFRNHDEYAWQKKDLQQVFDYCTEAAIAILGGEAWVVRRVEDCGPDEPTEPRHNLDPQRRNKGSVLGRSASHVIYGILPFRDGQTGVFSWNCQPRQNDQSWQEYAGVTVADTARIIEKSALESEVIEEHSAHVYYNLVFEYEDEASSEA